MIPLYRTSLSSSSFRILGLDRAASLLLRELAGDRESLLRELAGDLASLLRELHRICGSLDREEENAEEGGADEKLLSGALEEG